MSPYPPCHIRRNHMIHKINPLPLPVLLCTILPLLMCGCMGQDEGQDTTSGLSNDTWFAIADPIAENILQSINTDDYQAYSRDFSQDLLDQTDSQAFESMRNQIITAMGQYISKERSEVLEDEDYISVNYLVQFEGGKLIFRVVFGKGDESHQVQGVWFNNP